MLLEQGILQFLMSMYLNQYCFLINHSNSAHFKPKFHILTFFFFLTIVYVNRILILCFVSLCLIRYSGPTIHFVDEHYDTGRILAQSVVPVLAKDTAEELAARVLQEVMIFYITLFPLHWVFFFFLVGGQGPVSLF